MTRSNPFYLVNQTPPHMLDKYGAVLEMYFGCEATVAHIQSNTGLSQYVIKSIISKYTPLKGKRDITIIIRSQI